MNKNFLTATIVGAVVLFVTGYLIFELALGGFYEANQGSATGVMRDSPQWMWFIISLVAWAAVLALALGWSGAEDPASGFRVAAVVGLLVALSFDFAQFAWTNLITLTLAVVDPIVGAGHAGIAGAVMGMMMGRGSKG